MRPSTEGIAEELFGHASVLPLELGDHRLLRIDELNLRARASAAARLPMEPLDCCVAILGIQELNGDGARF